MTFLFGAPGKDLKSFFESLTIEDVRDNIHSSTFYKGKDYYENGYVSDAKYTYDQSNLTAQVHGNLKYDVNLELREGKLYGKCSCPVDGGCKHIVATLLFAVQEPDHVTVAENRGTGSPVRQQLQSLSKAELIAMVEKYAPEQFYIETKNRYSGSSEAIQVFKKVEQVIGNLFQDSESLYSPYDFEAGLVKEIGKLSGLEKHLKEELGQLILYIIREVDNAFDAGYLYDHYNDVNFEEPEAFTTLAENYIKSLGYSEKIDFLRRLDVVLTESSYLTFESLSTLTQGIFSDRDLPALKTMLVNEYKQLSVPMVIKYYGLVRPLMTWGEKEIILLNLKDESSSWLIELAELYKTNNRQMDAVKAVKKWLSKHSGGYGNEQVYSFYLDLLKAQNLDMLSACHEAITRCPTNTMLQKIAVVGQGDTKAFEIVLEQKNVGDLLNYLEKEERVVEALDLIKRSKGIWEEKVFQFFKKHKQKFPVEASNYFCKAIDKNLQNTGNHYYETIADALTQIRQINPSQAMELIADIRKNYKRRRNLMLLIS